MIVVSVRGRAHIRGKAAATTTTNARSGAAPLARASCARRTSWNDPSFTASPAIVPATAGNEAHVGSETGNVAHGTHSSGGYGP